MKPNLHTPGNGLLETHITWDDIEQRIREERNLQVSFGPKKTIRSVGDGKGFMSRIGVIDADFHGELDGLPKKFAIKMVCILGSLEIAETVKERHGEPVTSEEILEEYDRNTRLLHNREVNVYRVFSRFDNSVSRMPSVYFSKGYTDDDDVKGYIGMDFVENAELRHIYHNVKPEELLMALQALAYLEAKSLELNEEEKQGVASNFIPIIYPSMMHPAAVSKFFNDMYMASEKLRPTGEILEKMTEELVQLELTSTLNGELGMKDVFVHGDLWSNNLIWGKTAHGVELERIVDYQLAHLGCAAEDLCRMFITTMSGNDRRKNWERLLDAFYGYIEQYCKEKLPFTLEQLKESYQRMFPLAGVLLLPVFDIVVKMATQKLDEEEKRIVKSTMSEKTLALFEDILYFARRNREVRRV